MGAIVKYRYDFNLLSQYLPMDLNQKFNQFNNLIHKNPINKFTSAVRVVLILFVAVSGLVFAQRLLRPVGDATRSQAAVPDTRVSQKLTVQLQSSTKTTAIVHLRATPPTKENVAKIQNDLLTALRGYNFSVKMRPQFASGIILEVDGPTLAKLRTLGDYVSAIEDNYELKPQMQQARKIDQILEVEAAGYVPADNIAVVVIDSGVNSAHPFLNGRVVDETCIGDDCPSPSGPGSAAPCTWDLNPMGGCNHGTLVAGAITGGIAGTTDRYAGAVPGVKIIAIRAGRKRPTDFDPNIYEVRYEQGDIWVAWDWILSKLNDPTYPWKIAAVNMSLSTTADQPSMCGDANDRTGVLAQLWDMRAPVVAAAMNESIVGSLGNPACSPFVIAVGSVTKQKQISSFSNTASWQPNFILAPGGTGLSAPVGENILLPSGTNQNVETSGTSFAAPQVAGGIALMRSLFPEVTTDEFVKALKVTGTLVKDSRRADMIYDFPLMQLNSAINSVRSAGPTASCASSSGTVTTCTGPVGTSTLGVSDGQVLQANAGQYKNMALVTASYRAATNVTAQVTSLTYCGSAMTRVGGTAGRAKNTHQTTEMWYLVNPPAGTCQYIATFSANPEERVLSATVFNNVDSINPIESYVTSSGGGTGQPGVYSQAKTGPKDSMMECILSSYPNGNANIPLLTSTKSRQLFTKEGPGKLVTANLGSTYQRAVANENMTLTWSTTQNQNFAMTCANIRLAAPIIPTPPPVPPSPPPVSPPPVSPSPPVSPTPSTATVNIKANNSDGPVILTQNNYDVTISWTSSGVASCTASGGVNNSWGGTRSTSGTMKVQPPWTNEVTYTLRCTTSAGKTVTDSVVVRGPYFKSLNLSVSGPNDSVTIPYNTQARLSWLTYNIGVSACTASGGWTGSKAINGNQLTGNLTTSKSYTLTCGTTAKSVAVTVASAPPANTLDFRINGATNSTFLDVGTYPAVVTWNFNGTATCTASGHPLWTGAKASSGTQAVNLQIGSYDFTLTCGGATKTVHISGVLSSGSGIPPSPTPVPSSSPVPTPTTPPVATPTPPAVVKGLTGTYFPSTNLTGKGVSRIDPYIQFYWAPAAPISGIPATNFSARWSGALIVPTTGAYTFYIEADDGMRLFIDETLVIDKWTWALSSGIDHAAKPLTLTAGKHKIVVEYNQATGGAKAVVRWSGPGITKRVIPQTSLESVSPKTPGVKANYFMNETLTGTSTDRIEPAINFNWGKWSPFSTVFVTNSDYFSARWTGYLTVTTAGNYLFYTEADDGIRVWVDGNKIMDYWWWQSHYGVEKVSGNVNLSAGVHAVLVEAHDATGGSKAMVRLSGPNISKQIIPLFVE